MAQLISVTDIIWRNLLAIWPYLLLTIPLSVAVKLSGASRYILRAFTARPLVAIVLATALGAFSPFCSCTVIPVVASLLIGGVPLAPVMAFWVASPAMDPEIFFLSVSMLGWELALWRLLGALALSLGAGLVTHGAMRWGWLGPDILRLPRPPVARETRPRLPAGRSWPGRLVAAAFTVRDGGLTRLPAPATAGAMPVAPGALSAGCAPGSCARETPPWRRRLLSETWAATRLVVQFMALAFLLEAVILLYAPEAWIVGLLGGQSRWAVPLAALLGVPVYTSNLTALPLVGGLLTQGMHPAAALAFLLAGPTTTLPAMAAVWGLVRRRVFALYVLLSLAGALGVAMLYALAAG